MVIMLRNQGAPVETPSLPPPLHHHQQHLYTVSHTLHHCRRILHRSILTTFQKQNKQKNKKTFVVFVLLFLVFFVCVCVLFFFCVCVFFFRTEDCFMTYLYQIHSLLIR